jgi:hypothetical protein
LTILGIGALAADIAVHHKKKNSFEKENILM